MPQAAPTRKGSFICKHVYSRATGFRHRKRQRSLSATGSFAEPRKRQTHGRPQRDIGIKGTTEIIHLGSIGKGAEGMRFGDGDVSVQVSACGLPIMFVPCGTGRHQGSRVNMLEHRATALFDPRVSIWLDQSELMKAYISPVARRFASVSQIWPSCCTRAKSSRSQATNDPAHALTVSVVNDVLYRKCLTKVSAVQRGATALFFTYSDAVCHAP